MEPYSITSASYLAASFLFAVLALIYSWQAQQKIIHWSVALACYATSGFYLSVGLDGNWLSAHSGKALAAILLTYVVWIFATTATLGFLTKEDLPRKLKKIIFTSATIVLLIIAIRSRVELSSGQTFYIMYWSGLLLSVAALITVEQLYKNIEQNRQIKLLCLCLNFSFIFDIFMHSHALTYSGLNPDVWQARAVVGSALAAVLILGSVTLNPRSTASSNLSLSRPIAFYSTSLTGSGIFISVLAVGGYYVQQLGGSWGVVFYTLFLFCTLLAIAITFVSSTAREFLSVLINKHFFSHKYDYRTEWLKLIATLSQPTLPDGINQRAYRAICDIVKSPGGALWLKEENNYCLAYQEDFILEVPHPMESVNSDFATILRKQEWVFIPQSTDDTNSARYNEHLPSWLKNKQDVWLVLPLLNEHDLYGFMVLTKPKLDSSLTWEDRDLLKTVGRQVTSYLERHRQALKLTESSQFDTFNRLSAFIMHDLKNLIAQQALVVKNAAKHKDNPAFIEDAINTIDNSVNRMSGLLKKLQTSEPNEIRNLSLHELLIEAVRKCETKKPAPTLRLCENDGTINADRDRLLMAITHLIINAQDATPNSGFVDVSLNINQGQAHIEIEDSGQGMDEYFLKTRLFKPFDSTKEGKGMGIGAYQAKEIATTLGGSLSVQSTPEEGSTFTLCLPQVNNAADREPQDRPPIAGHSFHSQ